MKTIPGTWRRLACLVPVMGLLQFTVGCLWTPQIETELHNSSRGIVSLRTLADDSLPTDHPVIISPTTMEQILRGAHTFRDPRLIEGLITDDDKPKRLFSQSQIAFLAPLLTSALGQATPEENVFFQCSAEFEGAPPIEGSILVHDSTLFFTWSESLSKPKVLAKQHRQPGMLMDPSMPQGHMITFFPQEAIRVENQSTNHYSKQLGENTLAIDYQLLAGLPKSVFEIPELQDDDDESKTQHVGGNNDEPGSAEVQSQEKPTTAGTPDTSEASSDIRALREQMEQLQKEVDKQQEELERLKKDKP